MSTEPIAYVVPTAVSPEHEIVTTRVLPFPRPHVFAAWTHPALHARWWGPAGFTNTFYNYDVRPGGHWRFTMHGPDGTNYENHSVFEHVEDGVRLVFRHLSQPVFTVVTTLADAADGPGTRCEFRMLFEDAKVCAAVKSYAAGKNEENFDRLEAVLRETPTDSDVFRELTVIREIEAPVEHVYRVWTTRLQDWWCPRPWTTPGAEIDFRAGGRLYLEMKAPNEPPFPLEGVILEATPNERIVFTDAYRAGWRPTPEPFMTGIFEFKAMPDGCTRYQASARHWSAEACATHQARGFRGGWGVVADQLIAVVNDDAQT